MSVAAPTRAAAPGPLERVATPHGDGARSSTVSRPRRVLLACLALFALYGGLSLLNDPRGTLGTDTGGKLASLEAMDRNGGLDPDLGYWAEELDPDGSLHPLPYTQHIDGHWVNLTTLPMAYAAYPLYEIGGIRAALLLPMAGAVLCALGARALARRVAGERAGWHAFWLVGLATPIAVYALDFWEHSLGVAAVVFAVVLAYDVAVGRAGWRAAGLAGLLLGAAATLRTEAFVYAAVIGACTLFVLVRRRTSLRALVELGTASVGAALAVLVANDLVERATLGGSLRAGRAADVAASAAGGAEQRAKEALTTFIGVNRFVPRIDWFMGAVLVACVAYGAWKLMSRDRHHRHLGGGALLVAAVLYAALTSDYLGFMPGLLTASPLAVAGLVAGSRERSVRPLLAVAVLALPLVWMFQYAGGGGPQWGGRYVLVSGALLATIAAVALASSSRTAVVGLGVLGLAVTLTGTAYLAQRSHVLADAFRELDRTAGEVVISQEAHLLREGGAFYRPERQWLTAVGDSELREAVDVAARSGADTATILSGAKRDRPPRRIGEFRRAESSMSDFLPRFTVRVTTYVRAAS